MNFNKNPNLTPREKQLQTFTTCRLNLLIVVILTVVNIVLFFAGSETMMLFSASVPYMAVILATQMPLPAAAYLCYGVAVVCIVVYFLCWLLSKKHVGWFIPALVFFVLDTVAMGLLYLTVEDASGLLDIFFHAYVLYYLVMGLVSGYKLKKMPVAEELPKITLEEDKPQVDPEHWAE